MVIAPGCPSGDSTGQIRNFFHLCQQALLTVGIHFVIDTVAGKCSHDANYMQMFVKRRLLQYPAEDVPLFFCSAFTLAIIMSACAKFLALLKREYYDMTTNGNKSACLVQFVGLMIELSRLQDLLEG